MTHPGWCDSEYFQDERGFLTPTPYGDIVDVLLSDALSSLIDRYPLLVVTTRLRSMRAEVKNKIEEYVLRGGTAVVTAEAIESVGGVFGVQASGESPVAVHASGASPVAVKINETVLPLPRNSAVEECDFEAFDIDTRRAVGGVEIAAGATVLQASTSIPLVYHLQVGRGTMWVLATNGVCTRTPVGPKLTSQMDVPLATPRPILNHVQLALDSWLRAVAPFTAGDLSVVTTALEGHDNEYAVGVGNPHLTQSALNIASGLGAVTLVQEVLLHDVDKVGRHTPGWFPTGFNKSNTGRSSNTTIAGLDQRVFRVTVDGSNTHIQRETTAPPTLPMRRALPLSNIEGSLAVEVKKRPTFFDWYSAVLVDWRWILHREESALAEDGRWALRQGLDIIVDFTDGINEFPDLRLHNNSASELRRSIETIGQVFRKMGKFVNASVAATVHGRIAKHAIIALHSTPPTQEVESLAQAKRDVVVSVARLVQIAASYGVTLHLRVGATTSSEFTRPPITLEEASAFLKNVSAVVSPLKPDLGGTPRLKLLLSLAQLAVQGYNSSSFPRHMLPDVGCVEVAAPVIDRYGGALVSVNGPLAGGDSDWSESHEAIDADEATNQPCVLAENMTWRSAPFGGPSSGAPAPTPASSASDCCAACSARPGCGVATWSGEICYIHEPWSDDAPGVEQPLPRPRC